MAKSKGKHLGDMGWDAEDLHDRLSPDDDPDPSPGPGYRYYVLGFRLVLPVEKQL